MEIGERIKLEEYLFQDSNKVNRNAMKYILSKWSLLKSMLQEAILEEEKLKAVNECLRLTQNLTLRFWLAVQGGNSLISLKQKEKD